MTFMSRESTGTPRRTRPSAASLSSKCAARGSASIRNILLTCTAATCGPLQAVESALPDATPDEALERILDGANDGVLLLDELAALPAMSRDLLLARLSLAGTAACPWDDRICSQLNHTLEDLPQRALRLLTEEAAPLDAKDRETLADVGLAVMALRGGSQPLSVAIELFEQGALPRAQTCSLQARLVQAGRVLLDADPSTYAALALAFEEHGLPVRMALVRALSEVATERSYLLLPRLLGVDRRLDAVLLTHIARLAKARLGRIDETGLRKVRACLSSSSPMVCRQAILTSGALDDHEAVDILIDLMLNHGELHEDAGWSLRHITGLGFRSDPIRWSSWYDSEAFWWEKSAPQLLSDLHSPTPGQLVPSILELSRHRLFRDELAAELVPLLEHRTHSVVKAAIDALRGLGSTLPVPELTELLEHPESDLRATARQALETITRRDHLPNSADRQPQQKNG